MQSHRTYIIIAIVIVLVVIGTITIITQTCCANEAPSTTAQTETSTSSADDTRNYFDRRVSTDPRLERLFNEKIVYLQTLAQNTTIIQTADAASGEHDALSPADIIQLDEEWRTASKDSELVSAVINSDTAEILRAFRTEHTEFPELFFTDSTGFIVSATNKTTDYYQADEEWWQDSYNMGAGQVCIGPLEFDESSETGGFGFCLPLFNEQGVVVGILKAILSVNAVQDTLSE